MGFVLFDYIDGLVQDCSNSSALAMKLLHSCTKPTISFFLIDLYDFKVIPEYWILTISV